MIKLEELTIWKNLSSPYKNSEEIPALILKLSKTNQKEIADELIWEYLSHQGSIYESTLATIPHLLKIIKDSNDDIFKFDTILSLGVIFPSFDSSSNLDTFFQRNTLHLDVKNRIQTAFINSIKEFRNIVESLLPKVELLDESSKRYFLIAYLVSKEKYNEAGIFQEFSENEEYMFVCPNCEAESFLWNENNVLNAYDKDPIFNEDKKKIDILLDDSNNNLVWLEEFIDKININSLRSLMPYFKGNMNCHNCEKQTNIFDGILNSI